MALLMFITSKSSPKKKRIQLLIIWQDRRVKGKLPMIELVVIKSLRDISLDENERLRPYDSADTCWRDWQKCEVVKRFHPSQLAIRAHYKLQTSFGLLDLIGMVYDDFHDFFHWIIIIFKVRVEIEKICQ